MNFESLPVLKRWVRGSLHRILIGGLIGWCLLLWSPTALALPARWGEEQKLLLAVWTYLDRAYVDPGFNGQDWWKVRQKALSQPLPDRAAAYQVIDQMVGSLGDPFTRFLDREHYSNLQTSTAGELSGVGLQIAIDENDRVMVVTPLEGSPAEQAGLKSGDQVLAIDEKPTVGWTLDQVAEKMRGPSGSRVQVKLQRGSAIFTVILTRGSIAINPVRSRILPRVVGRSPVAYLRLNQFNGNAAQQIRQVIQDAEAEKVAGYIFDLRNNPGGLLQAAIEIGQMWIPAGNIVLITGRNGVQDSISASSEVLTRAPLVVLVNQGSASASEVLAGALQDSKRGILVGSRTFGKGLIQSLFELPDGSGLAVTTAKYMTPSGRDINKLGIEPDVTLDLPEQPLLTAQTIGTDADPQFVKGLEILKQQITGKLASAPIKALKGSV